MFSYVFIKKKNLKHFPRKSSITNLIAIAYQGEESALNETSVLKGISRFLRA